MNRYAPLIGIALCIFMLSVAAALAQTTSSVVASGAVSASNALTRITASIGQPAIGNVRAANSTALQGFWHPATAAKAVTGADAQQNDLASFSLACSPNPVSESATISFSLTATEQVSLVIFNAIGQQVQTVLERQLDAGTFSEEVDLSGLASGQYTVLLRAGERRTSISLLHVD